MREQTKTLLLLLFYGALMYFIGYSIGEFNERWERARLDALKVAKDILVPRDVVEPEPPDSDDGKNDD